MPTLSEIGGGKADTFAIIIIIISYSRQGRETIRSVAYSRRRRKLRVKTISVVRLANVLEALSHTVSNVLEFLIKSTIIWSSIASRRWFTA